MSDPRPRCPYCNSKQTRYTPSKSGFFTSKYTCKGCGNNFEIENFSSDETKSKGSCLGSILKLSLFVITVVVGISIFIAIDKSKSNKEQPKIVTNTKADQSHIQDVEEAVEAERSEHAAHDYIPTEKDYKDFEQKQKVQKSDNLTTVETIRESQ
jgi:cytoskeletal protein RodZ